MSSVRWVGRLVWFLVWYAGVLVSSTVRVVRDIATPRDTTVPGIYRVATDCVGDFETALAAIAISLTPGSLVVATEQSTDDGQGGQRGAVFFVHSLYSSRAEFTAETNEMTHRLLGALRPKGVRS